MKNLKYSVDTKINIDVPETASRSEIDEFTKSVREWHPEAENLPVDYVMVDSGQQIY